MKASISIGSAYYDGEGWDGLVEFVEAADRLGVDSAWSAEAWGMDSVASLGYQAIRGVRQGKLFEVELDARDVAAAQELLAELCKKLLANPVIEDFEIVSVE